jgi:hypothetical protein
MSSTGSRSIGAYLAAQGCTVLGGDVSASMVREARDRHPDIRSVSVDLSLFGSDEILGLLTDAGFTDCVATEREPGPAEHHTPRLYVRATRL